MALAKESKFKISNFKFQIENLDGSAPVLESLDVPRHRLRDRPFRAMTTDEDEQRAVRHSFAQSILAGFDVKSDDDRFLCQRHAWCRPPSS